MSDGRLCNAKSVSMVQCHVQCTQSMRQASVGWPGQILSGVHLAFLQSDLNYPADHKPSISRVGTSRFGTLPSHPLWQPRES